MLGSIFLQGFFRKSALLLQGSEENFLSSNLYSLKKFFTHKFLPEFPAIGRMIRL